MRFAVKTHGSFCDTRMAILSVSSGESFPFLFHINFFSGARTSSGPLNTTVAYSTRQRQSIRPVFENGLPSREVSLFAAWGLIVVGALVSTCRFICWGSSSILANVITGTLERWVTRIYPVRLHRSTKTLVTGGEDGTGVGMQPPGKERRGKGRKL